MFGAIASEELVRRFGTTRVVAAGLVIMTAAMPLVLLWDMNTSYLVVGPIVAMIALGIGLVFAPAAEAVMGAVEAAKAGVGSAMNDVTQMLAGALSIAVVGSVMYAIYAARLGDAAASLPARGCARPIRRCEVGIHGCAGAGSADRRRVLGRRRAYRCQVHASARH